MALVPVFTGIFIAADDQTVIVTVLPEIMLDLTVPISELDRASWTITGYLLGYVAAMPLIGRMSDVWGHRSLYVACMLLFMVGSVAAALTTSITWLVAARIFQAVGAGALVPISIAIVGDLFPSEKRAVPLGILGASAEAGGVIGPLWGGLISRFLDWPWVFWINLPLGALVLVFLLVLLRPSPRFPARIDYIGGGLIAISLTTLTLALSRVDAPDALFGVYLAATVAAIGTIRDSTANDFRAATAIASMFRAMGFNASNVTHMLIGGALIIGMVTVPLMANTVLGLDGARRRPNADAHDGRNTGGGGAWWAGLPAYGPPHTVCRRAASGGRRIRPDEYMRPGHRRPDHGAAPGDGGSGLRAAYRSDRACGD